MKTTLVFLVVVLGAIGGAVYYTSWSAGPPASLFKTVPVQRGDLLSTISATGTVEPEEVVDVGAQIAGKIETLGRDPRDPNKSIDYGSVVDEGTILARIDDSIYRAQMEQAQASLRRAEADLLQFQAKLHQAERDWKRAKELFPSRSIAELDYDVAQSNYESAKANLGVGEALIGQAKAALKLAETNMGYTIIKSPVRGVIIDRRVNVGQTVVASLNAPSLFLIAKDLRKMQVWASVNEADIGRIRSGMPVGFTVDAFPGEAFRGQVAQIRLNAAMTQNVVTYTVVVATDNSNLKLLPYLTANLQFEIENRKDVLMVPNAALRWKPRPQQMAPEVAEATGLGRSGHGERKSSSSGAADAKGIKSARNPEEHGRVWIEDGDLARPIDVQVGESDGTVTEISSPQVKEGLEVVIGEKTAAEQAAAGSDNPFIPKLFKGGRSRRHP